MKSSRRHESLIPLSREHHYGLMLCLRIHQGLSRNAESEWLRKKAGDVVKFFEEGLISHFKAEEEIVFPAMKNISGATDLIAELVNEHRNIEKLVATIAKTDSGLASSLVEFADLLEAHIRKEERRLFPLYESNLSDDAATRVGISVRQLIGDAMKPSDPEVLK